MMDDDDHCSAFSPMRDLETMPYSPAEQRVAGYLTSICPDIGAGDDPIGFLMASHAQQRADMAEVAQKLIFVEQRLKDAIAQYDGLRAAITMERDQRDS